MPGCRLIEASSGFVRAILRDRIPIVPSTIPRYLTEYVLPL